MGDRRGIADEAGKVNAGPSDGRRTAVVGGTKNGIGRDHRNVVGAVAVAGANIGLGLEKGTVHVLEEGNVPALEVGIDPEGDIGLVGIGPEEKNTVVLVLENDTVAPEEGTAVLESTGYEREDSLRLRRRRNSLDQTC
jgi:hypothetical protein